jgi:RNA polymerase sigma factor (sigma-70 family)
MAEEDARLSRIDTLWTIVRRAHGTPDEGVRQAQEALLERYGGAVRRYLLGALRNEDAADELFQEFSLKLVGGAFQRADAQHGRFRNFLKTSLFHLIVDHQRRQQRRRGVERPLPDATPDRAIPSDDLTEQELAWTRSWREEILAKGWQALADAEQNGGPPYHTALRFRLDHPEMHSPELAAQLGARLGRPLTAASVRVLLHRAREMFAERLLGFVQESLDGASLEETEQELIELRLLEYCRSALKRCNNKAPMS